MSLGIQVRQCSAAAWPGLTTVNATARPRPNKPGLPILIIKIHEKLLQNEFIRRFNFHLQQTQAMGLALSVAFQAFRTAAAERIMQNKI